MAIEWVRRAAGTITDRTDEAAQTPAVVHGELRGDVQTRINTEDRDYRQGRGTRGDSRGFEATGRKKLVPASSVFARSGTATFRGRVHQGGNEAQAGIAATGIPGHKRR